MNQLVSIITPNYNASKYISETIQSVIDQTYENWELIIIDDCSTDNSVEIIKQFQKKDQRIQLITLNRNSGPAVARNKGIEVSNGDFIAFLDSDDSWIENKLEIQVRFMQNNNSVVSHTSYYTINELNKDKKLVIAKEKITYKNLLTNNYIGCLTAMYSVKHLGKVYMPKILKRQDWALWLKITKNGVIAEGIQQPLALYNKRQVSVSSNKINLLKYNWKIYRVHENLNRLQSLYYFIQLAFKKIVK
ncbi:MAG: glycosyltransferase family 2 protein [Lutibacter sp.]|uniref:glycosyltransferase family 2 protein n=1 Tax=Lutibacter sp. TaxID=1925666 RepID=UPI00385C81D2